MKENRKMIQTETTISVNGIEKPYAGLKVLEKIDFTVERGARGIEGRADERQIHPSIN